MAPRALFGPAHAVAARSPFLADALDQGIRLGEAAVASHCVHILRPADPDAVTVLVDRDAGQVFYGRRVAGAITHIDVFHAPALVPPAAVRTAFAQALREWRGSEGSAARGVSPDWFDVQTAVAGGRLSGELSGGLRPTVLAAHRGHVHLAGVLPPSAIAFALYLVAALELELAQLGCPPRRVQRVLAERSGAADPLAGGLEPYAALTDSWLREPSPPPASLPVAPLQERLLVAAATLASDLGDAEGVRSLLDVLAQPAPASLLRGLEPRGLRLRDALARLVQEGWAVPVGSHWALTPAGMALRQTFRTRLREVELAMRTAARRSAAGATGGLPDRGAALAARRPRAPRARLPERGEALGAVAVSETALAAARRVRSRSRFRVTPADIRVVERRRTRPVDLCLLLDASASMEGSRMRAAKTLARHLLLTGRERVAVMAFQERAAVLAVPLTRNYAAAERGLARVVPAGLTPLAAGLQAARQYLEQAHARNPLLLLVTDGIPTVGLAAGSPLEEALEEADRLKATGVVLCCIGLEPNEHYLSELAHRAGGRLHVVPELRPDLLAAVARHERLRRLEDA